MLRIVVRVGGGAMNGLVQKSMYEYLDAEENSINRLFILAGIRFWKDEYEKEGETFLKFLEDFLRGCWLYTARTN